MKLLLDSCVWGKAADELKTLGHDVIWAGDWSRDPGDQEILAMAYAERRVLVTLDKDFGELAVMGAVPHSGIIRLVHIAARQQASVCQLVVSRHSENLARGAIVTAEVGRLRIRLPYNPDSNA